VEEWPSTDRQFDRLADTVKHFHERIDGPPPNANKRFYTENLAPALQNPTLDGSFAGALIIESSASA
jgi:hypothetical protein